MLLLAIVFWVLWKARNKMIIEGLFVRNPVELIFRIISCFQKWDVLLRAADQKTLDVQKLQVAAWVDSSLQVPKESYNSFM